MTTSSMQEKSPCSNSELSTPDCLDIEDEEIEPLALSPHSNHDAMIGDVGLSPHSDHDGIGEMRSRQQYGEEGTIADERATPTDMCSTPMASSLNIRTACLLPTVSLLDSASCAEDATSYMHHHHDHTLFADMFDEFHRQNRSNGVEVDVEEGVPNYEVDPFNLFNWSSSTMASAQPMM